MFDYPEKVYLNGEIFPHQEAKISVFDRGFIFGDGVYEVMVKINGNLFYGDAHLKRLSESLQKIQINFDVNTLEKELDRLLKASHLENQDCLIYMQITRGVAPRKHAFPKGVSPTVMMFAKPFVLPDMNQKHLKAVTLLDYRWNRCDIKMTSLLGNIMTNEYAVNHDAYESVLIRDGVVTEASHCNVFFVKDNVVYTHPSNELILDGITRQIVIQLCVELGIDVIEQGIKEKDIYKMDELFLTGTTTLIASVKQLNEHYFYQENNVGNITKKLQEAFLKLKK